MAVVNGDHNVLRSVEFKVGTNLEKGGPQGHVRVVSRINNMKDREVLAEQELRNIYYDPSAGYQSAERLYQKARERSLGVSRRAVRDWLKTQDAYTRYKSIVRKHKYRKTFVKDLADQVQLDLVDMGKYGSKNKGYR